MVSDGQVEHYMSKHRQDNNINKLNSYFVSVIEWVNSLFDSVEPQMKNVDWGKLYKQYHTTLYNVKELNANLEKRLLDGFIGSKKDVYEFLLGGKQDTRLLNIRIFPDTIKREVYNIQTKEAKANKLSNCPLCALGTNDNKIRIWKLTEMDADHVTAWSKGSSTDKSNCEMLCNTHNRAKGNK